MSTSLSRLTFVLFAYEPFAYIFLLTPAKAGQASIASVTILTARSCWATSSLLEGLIHWLNASVRWDAVIDILRRSSVYAYIVTNICSLRQTRPFPGHGGLE